jgi:putative transposase
MAKSLSIDLRERAVAAVEKEGLSRRQAAARFGVAASTVIHWVRRLRETDSLAPRRRGGRRPKKIAGEYRDWLVLRCREADFTLRGLKVDYHSIWTFVHAEKLTHKKRR